MFVTICTCQSWALLNGAVQSCRMHRPKTLQQVRSKSFRSLDIEVQDFSYRWQLGIPFMSINRHPDRIDKFNRSSNKLRY